MVRLILASASVQRKKLLENLGVSFEVIASQKDESECAEADPLKRNSALARMKAEDVAFGNPDAWVLGCDTLVVAQDGMMLEKPADAADARAMLRRQSGGISLVHSSLCVLSPSGEVVEATDTSKVTFKELRDEELDWWIETGLWEGRSGAFQIEGAGQLLIEKLEGDWTGVVGLPVFLFGQMAKKAGLNL